MCGINLLLDLKSRLSSDQEIRSMSEATRHRGPDAEACLTINKSPKQLFIGNNRLKIMDLSRQGNQPMQCGERGEAGQRYTISYNGELYNYFDLKNELLQKGYQFRSTGDTEVLLYALAEWGEKAISRLEGMFAFVFYDQQNDLLLLARDRQGIKPLYYYQDESFLLASSELRGILATGLVKKELNERQLYHYLQFRYARKPETFYKNIYELLPGYGLRWKGNEQNPQIFPFSPREEQNFTETDPAEVVNTVEEKLTDALFSHLHADRPAGMFLSGGIDSTLMLALLRNNGSYHLPACFTIANSESEARWGTEDYLWAGRAARQYEARHEPVEIDSSLLHEFPAFIAEQDQPVGDSAAWLTSLLCRKAGKEGFQVILSGAGADEFFGGYNRHKAFYTYLKHHRKVRRLLPFLRPAGALVPPGMFSGMRKPLRLWKKLSRSLEASPEQTFLNFLKFQQLTKSGSSVTEHRLLEQEPDDFVESWMRAALQHDRNNYLPSDLLALNDKAGMQHSLEIRTPYLADDLCDYAGRLPARLLMEQGPKWILGEILKKHGGTAYTERKKEGFGLPFGLWIKEGKTDPLWQWVHDKDHPLLRYVAAETITKQLELHKSGKEDFSQELFSLAVLAHWLSKEFT